MTLRNITIREDQISVDALTAATKMCRERARLIEASLAVRPRQQYDGFLAIEANHLYKLADLLDYITPTEDGGFERDEP